MDKTIIITIAIICFSLINCREPKTPKQFLYEHRIDKVIYKQDSQYFTDLYYELLKRNIYPFKQKDIYDAKTILTVDTILYSPLLDKMVVFIIVKNDYKKYNKNDPYPISKYKFEAYHFYSYRKNKNEIISNKKCVYLFEAYKIERLREMFLSYALIRKSTDHPFAGQPQYNLNDIRFWSSKQMAFEMTDSVDLVSLKGGRLFFYGEKKK